MMPEEGAQGKMLQDYEDYYDRSIQLRVMENQTLRQQLFEKETDESALRQKYLRCVKISWLVGGLISLFVAEMLFPSVLYNYVASISVSGESFATHAVCMLIAWKVRA